MIAILECECGERAAVMLDDMLSAIARRKCFELRCERCLLIIRRKEKRVRYEAGHQTVFCPGVQFEAGDVVVRGTLK